MIYLLGYPRQLSYDLDWIQAFVDHYGDTCLVHLGRPPQADMGDAQLVVLLHSCTAQGVHIPPWVYTARRRSRKTPWLMLSGNDYKLFSEKRRAAGDLSIDVLGTSMPNAPYEAGNGIGKVAYVGYALNPKAFTPGPGFEDRPIKVGFRGFKYPDMVGDTLRNNTVEAFMHLDDTDVRWGVFDHPSEYAQWLQQCRTTPATEGGALGMKGITSRIYDSIGSRVALISTPGDYCGYITEDHYIRLESDFSNIDECLSIADDEKEWAAVTSRALAHVMKHHTYENRMEQLDKLLWGG